VAGGDAAEDTLGRFKLGPAAWREAMPPVVLPQAGDGRPIPGGGAEDTLGQFN